MKRDDDVYISHIYDAIKWIEQYTKNLNYKKFLHDHLVQDGVIRQIEIIGEASNKLSRALRVKYAHIPWKDVIGMRNKLIHDYFGVDLESVWETVKKDLPLLKEELEKIQEGIK